MLAGPALALWAAVAQAASFNDFAPGAKAMGLGMAFSAVADDPSALFFNPAGLANTPYTQLGTSLGRIFSPTGPMTFGALTYVRPYDPINTATVGSAYYVERQTHGGDKDEFLFHYSQEIKAPELFLTRPLKLGANFKFLNVDQGANGGGHFGMGFDAGALARSDFGLNGSIALTDLTTNVGVPRPALSLGAAYAWQRWLTAAGDLRVRPGLTEFYSGLEASFDQGLLKARIGRGFQLDGASQLALGLGVNLSPLVIDVAMTFPTGGVNRQAGGYQCGVNYRFGAPAFSGAFVGQAATQAEELKAEIARLDEERKNAEAKAAEARSRREISQGEAKVLQERVKALNDEYRDLQKRKDEIEYAIERKVFDQKRLTAPPVSPMPRLNPPPRSSAPAWPRRHVVQPGDTLRSLAKAYYGDPNLWEAIYKANKDKVDRGLPQEGATLIIPAPPAP